MAFIKAQKIVRDKKGVIASGSAAIVDTVYISTGSIITVGTTSGRNLARFSI